MTVEKLGCAGASRGIFAGTFHVSFRELKNDTRCSKDGSLVQIQQKKT